MTIYGTIEGVEDYVPTIAPFSASTYPSTGAVWAWLGEAASIIDRMLTTAGYTTPISTTAGAYNEIAGLAHLYAAARTLQARAIETATGELQPRWQMMFDEFYVRLESLTKTSVPGATAAAATTGGTARRIRGIQTVRVDRQVDTASEYT